MKGTIFVILLAAMVVSGLVAACASAPPAQIAAVTTTPPPAAAQKSGWEARWNNVIQEAKKEKGALIYMAPSPATQKALTETFKQKFDLDLEFVIGRGAVIAEKIFAERRAGLYLGDVVFQGSTVQILVFKPQNVLEKLDPYLILPEVTNEKVWLGERFPYLDRDHQIIYFFAGMRNYVSRNTDLVKADEVKSMNDLLNPKWKGQMVMFDPTIAGSGSGWFALVYGLFGQDKGDQYMKEFIKQEPMITRDDRVLVEGLARGKYKMGVGTIDTLFAEFKRNGAPVDMIRMIEGNFLAPSMGDVSILKNAPHPYAATLFFNWLLTKEGQTLVSKAAGVPSARMDVPTTGIDPYNVLPKGEKFYFESEDDVLAKDDLMVRARGIFAPLLK